MTLCQAITLINVDLLVVMPSDISEGIFTSAANH